jgi:ATP-dependent Clp protease ATP-binding subunit ClpC
MLDSFGKDLTRDAADGRLDPIVGRERELERIAQILSRRKKNNPILIGEAGVGKSAIAEGLAINISQGKVSRNLLNKRVIALDLASLVAGTKYRGQFEERMKAIMAEIEKNTHVILFIDEIHTLVGAGGSPGSLDASNMFKPALARGEMQCIGATTLDEYRQYIEKDAALERRFQKILLEPTTPEETEIILNNIKDKYEDHHLVRYTADALTACVALSTRYITDRCLPDKAIDAMDEAGARVHIKNIKVPTTILNAENEIDNLQKLKMAAVKNQQYNEAAAFRDQIKTKEDILHQLKKEWETENDIERPIVTEEDVAEVIAMMTGVPVKRIAKNEGEKLMKMAEELEGKVIGQNEAILKISKSIRRNRAGLKDPNKPIGTFFFLGATGVGKTYLAKVLAEYLFDSQENIVRIDMSEYMEKHTVSRLIGAPPGYVGYEEGGQLTEKVRRKPYSIVLLDEIEKAHPDVYNVLLQVFDDGVLTDGIGRKVDFKNTILIMTSNIGSRELKDFGTGMGFSTAATTANKHKTEQSILENALKKTFAPEFINRIDDIIFFNNLEKEDIIKIIDIELKKVLLRIKNMGLNVSLSNKAKEYLAEVGWDSNYGARPLKRAIQKYVEDVLAEEILLQTYAEHSKLILDYDEMQGMFVKAAEM